MSDLVMQGIVRIRNSYGNIGTGFVLSRSGLIVTCSHVIQSKESQQLANEPLPEKVSITFYATGEEQDARVLSQWWHPYNEGDVAIIQLEGMLPLGIQPLPLGSAEGTSGHDIFTFGFPAIDYVDGLGGNGRVVKILQREGVSILQLQSSEITVGFSGGPIWDTLGRRVIGMVAVITNPDPHLRLMETAFAITSDTLRCLCPIIKLSDICPYRGLAAFREDDAEFFFGRQQFAESILNRLRRSVRFLTILGSSGSGKSSMVQAGCIPLLKKGEIPGSDLWGIITTRPASNPFEELVKQGFPDKGDDLVESTQVWLSQHPERERLVLIFDQFEELFGTYLEGERQKFIGRLTSLLQSPLPISVILVIRDDFYSRMTQHEELVRWVEQSQGPLHIPQILKKEELTAMVQKPAEVVGLLFEEGLVDAIVRDTLEASVETEDGDPAGRSAVLPLLEFALNELWASRQEGMLTHDVYRKIGTVAGSLTQWADRAFFALRSEEQQRLAHRIFTDLTYVGDREQGILDSRRQRTLASLPRNDNEKQRVERVIQQLVEKRLLVTDRDLYSDSAVIEIIHDILLRKWGMLRFWIEEDRTFLQWHQELEKPIRVWSEQHDTNMLLRGRNLAEAKEWLQKRGSDLDKREVEFIHACVKNRIKSVLLIMLAFVLLISTTGAAGWYYQHQAADPTLVTTLSDNGPGSLRYCINNIHLGTIRFVSSLRGVIHLTSGDITIRGNITIDGPGANLLTVSAGNSNSAIFVASTGTVTFSGLSFLNSTLQGKGFINNNNHGTLQIINSVVANNSETGANGGSIVNTNSSHLTIINSSILANYSHNIFFGGSGAPYAGGGLGGGIYNGGGTVTVKDSTISGNQADMGGGIYSMQGTINVLNSTIAGDSALATGGGIYAIGQLTVFNSTIAGNSAGSPYASYGGGGGIYTSYLTTSPQDVLLAFDTIYGNTTSQIGSAVWDNGNKITIADSISAANTSHAGTPDILNQTSLNVGELITGGYNLFQNEFGISFVDPNGLLGTDVSIQASDLSNIFGPHPQLQSNGGPTKTYALLPDASDPAIDKIPLNYCHIPSLLNQQTQKYTDQRAMVRPDGQETLCDIGAYEAGESTIAPPPNVSLSPTVPPSPTTSAVEPAKNYTEFPTTTPASAPSSITAGPDGNLWFTEINANQIGRITPSGTITEFAVPASLDIPSSITAGPDGNLWFTGDSANVIGRMTPAGTVTVFPLPTGIGMPTAGPDGNVWFTTGDANKIGRITPAGNVTEFTIPTPGSGPSCITAGSDGNLWFIEGNANKIGRITPAGTITEFAVPSKELNFNVITAGPDKNLWFTLGKENKIGRITPAGNVTEFTIPTPGSGPTSITAGPDGNLWFTEGQIGRITPSGVITEFALPTSNSGLDAIATGSDGNLWFTELSTNKIAHITPEK